MKNIIVKLKEKKDLTPLEIERAMQLIMSGNAAKEDIAAFLLGLKDKGPTIEEITGAAKIMRKFVLRVEVPYDIVLDTCGTGGDKSHTFNISTISALVVAACGVKVAKHGNRSVSSRCGSADILEGLGVNINMPVERLAECLDNVGIVFLFAQKLHPAMRNVASIRKELGVETIFNVLGPLTNPAMATHQMMGIYTKDLVEPMVYVLKNLGLKKAMVVHGSDGLDEVTTTGVTFVSEWNGCDVHSYTLHPNKVGLKTASLDHLRGGDLQENLAITQGILNGQQGFKTDIVVFNAGCALYVAQKVSSVKEGVKLAQEALASGAARRTLEGLRKTSCHVS